MLAHFFFQSKFENEAGNITMKYYAILILTVWSCAEWGQVDGSSHPTSGPFPGQHLRPPPQQFNPPPPPSPAKQSSPPPFPWNPRESQPAVLETIPPASSSNIGPQAGLRQSSGSCQAVFRHVVSGSCTMGKMNNSGY